MIISYVYCFTNKLDSDSYVKYNLDSLRFKYYPIKNELVDVLGDQL